VRADEAAALTDPHARGACSIAMPNMLTREFVEQLHLRMYDLTRWEIIELE
jgi:hypothetical protein